MRKFTLKNFLILPLLLLSLLVGAQNSSRIWTPASESMTASKAKEFRNSIPLEYQLFTLNSTQLKNVLSDAPSRSNLRNSNLVIELPTTNGKLERFKIVDASNFAPELQERHPDIRSFAGQGIDDPTAVARFSTSPYGVHVMISSAEHSTVYIDPYTQDKQQYISYSRKDLTNNPDMFTCSVEDTFGPQPQINLENIERNRNADDGKLRTFRLALACNGEYAQYHLNNQGVDPGATDAVKKVAVLSAMNVAMTRVNGIYERDLAITMQFIANNEDVIFLDTATDGLSNNSGMINEIQNVIDNAIGFSNYDIGHVFSTGGGGIAQLRSPCTGNKARGVTGLPSPINDPFYVDYVSHEMGHQYGGNHTQNNNCQRSNASYEPGSASTIMGYAGICPPNVQNVSDDYFHAISIQEMWSFITTGSGTCGAQSNTNNTPPTADAGPNYTLPKSTPFILSGVGTDPDGDALSYCWEQFDNQVAPMPPQSTSTVGPAFRSLDPTASPDRYMPQLIRVLIGQTSSTWEVVPSVGRTMNFRLTVRDNLAGGGSSASDNTVIIFDGNSGPFVVTSQSTTSEVWNINSTQTVTWDVANTNSAPVNAPTVDILLSTDGGQTFPTTLATGTANDGSEDITVPNVALTITARIMIKPTNSIFYDINNANFKIEEQLSTTDFAFENYSLWPNPTDGGFNLTFKPDSNESVNVSLFDLRGRLINQNVFENPSSTFSESFDYRSITPGVYFVTVKNGNKQMTSKLVKK